MWGRVLVFSVFALVYIGMVVGRFPRLAMDRTGIVVIGAIVLAVCGKASLGGGRSGIDVPTLLLLFGFMVISGQFRLGGFYSEVARKLAALPLSPELLLGAVVAVSGILSALLTNDVVCLAVTPVLGNGCVRKRLNPLPFLLALACAANIGSAATLMGNPQNMLIGQYLALSFRGYLIFAIPPTVLSLFLLWVIAVVLFRGKWTLEIRAEPAPERPFDRRQTIKAAAVLGVVVLLFLFSPFSRETVALAGAGVLLFSRTMESRRTLDMVDWQLLVLFMGLFVVNAAFESAGGLEVIRELLGRGGISLSSPPWLYAVTTVLSNLVSNVPAVMLLLPLVKGIHLAGPILALSSTFAGNLIIVGSIANIIVVGEAARLGIPIDWKQHARLGVPVTAASLAAGLLCMRLF